MKEKRKRKLCGKSGSHIKFSIKTATTTKSVYGKKNYVNMNVRACVRVRWLMFEYVLKIRTVCMANIKHNSFLLLLNA